MYLPPFSKVEALRRAAYEMPAFMSWCVGVGCFKLHRMASINVEFGRTVRTLRTKAGFSQESFADAIKVNRTYMGKLERGKGNPTLEMLARIAQGLGVSLVRLFDAMDKYGG
jgi:DNA-binding XRE family transcriptional regulator